MSKKVLVVGGAGYVGSVVIDKLLKNNFDVTCIDNLIYKNIKPPKIFKI